ncbi:putative phage protein [Escherichia coli]|nr:putative phage protein [Escherichia coli]
MMNIEELRKIFCEDGLYAVCVENGNLVSHYRIMKWSTKTGHRVRVFSSIDFPIRLVVTHHYIRAVLVRCNIQRYSPLLRELHR